ncbi:isopentenyl-diphosphate Delta-isomerase [Propionibacteriaceae bacterium Y1923]
MQEVVILVGPDGADAGTAPKSTVHTDRTPLHRAFSCYVFNEEGQVLITRRALSKLTWPGVWTNSVCGHPAPGETAARAIQRRMRLELGAGVAGVEAVLPDFRYQAVDASGVMENEVCPVHIAHLLGTLAPHPGEVAEWAWVDPGQLVTAVAATPMVFSPWVQLQIPQLVAAGLLPGVGS